MLRNNPLVTNAITHHYHLDESTLKLGASGVIFHLISFLDEFFVSKQNSPKLVSTFCGDTNGSMLSAYVP